MSLLCGVYLQISIGSCSLVGRLYVNYAMTAHDHACRLSADMHCFEASIVLHSPSI